MELLRDFIKLGKSDVALAGGKGASLGEMLNVEIPVPPGFVILSSAFEKFLEATDLNVEIDAILDSVNHKEMHTIENASEKIQSLILQAEMPQDITLEIQKFFKNLNSKYVAVRSSATAEDSASAAWAGQLESYLNTTEENLLENVKRCWASLFTPRAIFYRFEKGLHKQKISVAVVVQKMVESEKSGVAFSVHPVTQNRNQLIIEAGFGLGEAIVSGQITPDSYVVEKKPRRIIDKNVQTQSKGLYRAKGGGNEWHDIPKIRGERQVLSDSEILELSEIILRIENHYFFPSDIEWTFEDGKFYIVQSRPITTLKKEPQWIAKAHLNYEYFTFSAAAKSLRDEMPKIVGLPFNYKYENLDVLYDQNNIDQHIQNLLADPSSIKRQVNFIKEQIGSLSEASKIYGSKKDLASFEQWYSVFRKFLPTFGIVFGLESALEKELKIFLSEENFHKIAFAKETATALEQKSILQIAIMSNNSTLFEKAVNRHLKQFAWLGNKLMSYTPFTRGQILTRINTMRESAEQKIKEFEINRKHLERKAANVFKSLNNKEKKWVHLYQEVLFLRTERADMVAKSVELTYPLFKFLADKLNLSREELIRFSADEIIKMHQGGQRLNIEGREKYHATSLDGKIRVFWGTNGPEKDKIIGVDKIQGTIACKGVARGVVKIVSDVPDLKKVDKGDILVAPYTNPNMVQAMEKAAAIVTNIGGMTSHAAIVSRELNKPCIIGTQNATQVLNDGDFVEVDANIGVVRILK